MNFPEHQKTNRLSRLTCEGVRNPLGIDDPNPRLNWWNPDLGKPNQRQVAYQVRFADSPEDFGREPFPGWDSGRVACTGQDPAGIAYPGPELNSLQQIFWQVRTWNIGEGMTSARQSDWSEPAGWVVGMLDPKDWQQARWIGAGDENASAPQLRRRFSCGEIRRATLAICGIGLHEVYLNGEKVDDEVLAPAYTCFDKTALYRVLDLTDQLSAGDHTLGVWLGEGWLRQRSRDVWGRHKQPWIQPPKLLLHLRLEMADGRVETVVSDGNWQWNTGPITFACIVGGEDWDARKVDADWATNSGSGSGWAPARSAKSPEITLRPQIMPPIRVVERFRPARITTPQPGRHVIDAGKVLAGWVSLKLPADAGREVVIPFNERLTEDGLVDRQFFTKNNPERFQTERLTCGSEPSRYEPRFTYHGFQYLELDGLPEAPKPEEIEICEVHNDFPRIGRFTCSDQMVNRLLELIDQGHLSNCHGVPTDCPQREKNPWLYDSWRAAETAVHRFDMHQFYAKWVGDMIDSQESDGHLPACCPAMPLARNHPDGSPTLWTDPWYANGVMRVPLMLHRHYGDTEPLRRALTTMQAHCRQIQSRADEPENRGLVTWGLGDWLEPGDWQGFPRFTPIPLTGTIGLIDAWERLAEVATILDDKLVRQEALDAAQTARDRWALEFLDERGALIDHSAGSLAKWGKAYVREDGEFPPHPSQTATAMTLHWGLCPEDSRPLVFQQLLQAIERAENHLQVGFHGGACLFDVLCDEGHADLAWQIFTAQGHPGFANMIENGATSLWEHWELYDHFGSKNHPTWGMVGRFLHERIGGIAPAGPGWSQVALRPVFPNGLDSAEVEQHTPLGKITSRWKRENDKITWNLHLPPDTAGTMESPLGWEPRKARKVEAGEQTFVFTREPS